MKCKKDTENIDPKVLKTENCRAMLASTCNVCSKKKSRFMKEQEAKRLPSSLRIKTPLSKIPSFGDIFFWFYCLNLLNVNISML